MNAIELARVFHEAYERLAPEFGYRTREETRRFDPETPNGRLMVAVCREVSDVVARDSRRYWWIRSHFVRIHALSDVGGHAVEIVAADGGYGDSGTNAALDMAVDYEIEMSSGARSGAMGNG
jgi:hypothetical protein